MIIMDWIKTWGAHNRACSGYDVLSCDTSWNLFLVLSVISPTILYLPCIVIGTRKRLYSERKWVITIVTSRSSWPRGLRRRSAVARLLGLRVRIPPVAWMYFSCEYCCCTGRGFCVRPRGCVCVCVCVLLSVIKHNSNPLHPKWVGRRVQTEENLCH